jgi:hypothetical protein
MRFRVQFPVLPWGFFLEGEDFHGHHGLGSLVERRFKALPGTSEVGWPQPGGKTTKSIRDMWWHWPKKRC